MDKVTIIGCGWLGLPLGKSLVQAGYQVKGSTTAASKVPMLAEAGIQAQLLALPATAEAISPLLEADVVVVTIPPSNKKGTGGYEEQLRGLAQTLVHSPVSKVLYCSSSAVYENLNRAVVEVDASAVLSPHSGTVLLHMEEVFTKQSGFDTTVLRFGGLFGPGRNPGRFLAGKAGLDGGQNPVNMVHLDDCIGAIKAVIEKGAWGDVFNVCAPIHPNREDFYHKASSISGNTPPAFVPNSTTPHKLVNCDKLSDKLGYTFKYPDPILGL